MLSLHVNIARQSLEIIQDDKILQSYLISTGKNGAGEVYGSGQTPRGWHIVRAKIGGNAPINTVFVRRRPTGEIYISTLRTKFPDRDWILTRIFWLSGLELNKNRLGQVDTMRRFIYIHGSPDETIMGIPGSKGCIRMRNQDIIELFEIISVGTKILIEE